VSNFEDQTRTCADCGDDFIWIVGEQEFFDEKGFTDPPKRCKTCRQVRKNNREQKGSQK
jgi:hypothetical protein